MLYELSKILVYSRIDSNYEEHTVTEAINLNLRNQYPECLHWKSSSASEFVLAADKFQVSSTAHSP